MDYRTADRLEHILDAVGQIELLLQDKSFADLNSDRFLRAAYERFVEIISEASRHIPTEMKERAPEIPWRKVADIGNHLRHGYVDINLNYLWNLFAEGSLDELRQAVRRLINEVAADPKTP